MRRFILLFTLILTVASTSLSTTIHVPGDQPTIQTGLNTAVEDDRVLVAAGTYYENIVWPAVNGIKLIGSGQEDCVIDGDSLASVIRFEEELGGIIDTTTVVAGFTIQNGNAQDGYPQWSGGGTGKTTAEMQDVTTYNDLATEGLDEPWDFVGDPYDDSGEEDIWDIDSELNGGYPFLNWQELSE